MKILFVSSEIAPWVKTGGLGDVSAALPLALKAQGLDVRVLVPAYRALWAAFPDATEIARPHFLGGQLPTCSVRETITPEGLTLWLVDHAQSFDHDGNPYLDATGQNRSDNALRFGLLSRVAAWISSTASTLRWQPDIVHCNDWQTALVPVFHRYLSAGIRPLSRTLLTIHNLAFQGIFPAYTRSELGLPEAVWAIDGVEFYGALSFLKGGLQHADALTTVSPSYADEILTEPQGMGLGGLLHYRKDALTGILNGLDTTVWNPESDPYLEPPFAAYSARRLTGKKQCKAALQSRLGLDITPKVPLCGVISRLTEQKGLDLLASSARELLHTPLQLALLGSGDATLENAFCALAEEFPGRCAVRIGFDEALAHQIEAGADLFIMPSRFEPCGLNQMYSQRYGTLPIVRSTGGLRDTVRDALEPDGCGFVFEAPTPSALQQTLLRALEAWRDKPSWRTLQKRAMRRDFSWRTAAKRYTEQYENLLQSPPTSDIPLSRAVARH
jgi:starch synthase